MVYDPNYSSQATEGVASAAVTEIKKLIKDPQPTFTRMVVLETISDPNIITEDKIEYWKNVLRISNIRFASVLPRNTIIAQKALTGVTNVTPPMFLLPFFPSHLSLPCKPGELVWTMFESPGARIKEMGYWFCRIAEPHFIDDVNHTHHARQLDHSFNSTIKKRIEGNDDSYYELRNGKVNRSKDGTRFVVPDSEIISSDNEEVFELLIAETDAAKMMRYEAVPRFRKRPGDIALEGSNNSLIVLGTDRSGPVATYNVDDSDPEEGGILPLPTEDFVNQAGCIDIVTGRGTLESTGGKVVSTTRILDGQEIKKELGKSAKDTVQNEGDPDFKNDRSRILISQRTKVDSNFRLDEYQKDYNEILDSTAGDSAVVIKSDKIRIIARSDISLIVTNYEEALKDEKAVPPGESRVFKLDQSDTEKWASITIRRNGDIIFTPSDKGVIKLGGDDATKAILCTERPAKNEDGAVTSLPLATTGGGFVGTSGGNIDKDAIALKGPPDLGTFSRKVLIK